MSESVTKLAVRRIIKGYARAWFFMPQSGIFGVWGIPDFVGVANGRFVAIETKRMDKKTEAKHRQTRIADKIVAAGGTHFYIKDQAGLDELAAFMEVTCPLAPKPIKQPKVIIE